MVNIDLKSLSVALGVAIVMANDGGKIGNGRLAIEIADIIEQICNPCAIEDQMADSGDSEAIAQTLPWSFTHFGDKSEIETYSESTKTWNTVAETHKLGEIDAEDFAEFIVNSVNRRKAMAG